MLHGVIYLHRITDEKVGGKARRVFKAFSTLCGSEALQNVAIVTTMWDRPEVSLNLAQHESREEKLADDPGFFKPAMEQHATMFRHYNTKASTENIISHLLDKTPRFLRIQNELGEGYKVEDTEAGQEAIEILKDDIQKHKEQINKLNTVAEEGKRQQDKRIQNEVKEERKKAVAGKKKAETELKNFPRDYERKRNKATKDFKE
jgi:hypothetical protein